MSNFEFNENAIRQKKQSNLIKSFNDRLEKYSSLGWKNRKGLKKGTIEGQVPAFIINFFSKEDLAIIKSYPKVYNELSKLNLAFQYIKYKPKESLRLFTQRQLFLAKKKTKEVNIIRKRKGLKPFKMPTRESLGIKEKIENFKKTYPQILKMRRDGTIDTIKSDWTGYLVSFIEAPDGKSYKDGQILGNDFFFKNPALIWATTKTDIIDKINKKTKKVLEGIESYIQNFIYGSEGDYKRNEKALLKLAYSLTRKGILEKMEEERKLEAEKELNKVKTYEEKLDLDWNEFE